MAQTLDNNALLLAQQIDESLEGNGDPFSGIAFAMTLGQMVMGGSSLLVAHPKGTEPLSGAVQGPIEELIVACTSQDRILPQLQDDADFTPVAVTDLLSVYLDADNIQFIVIDLRPADDALAGGIIDRDMAILAL